MNEKKLYLQPKDNMSSSYDDYSRIHCKSILLTEAGVKFHLDTDDTKTITLNANLSSSGNINL